MNWSEQFPGFISILSSLKYPASYSEINQQTKSQVNGNQKVRKQQLSPKRAYKKTNRSIDRSTSNIDIRHEHKQKLPGLAFQSIAQFEDKNANSGAACKKCNKYWYAQLDKYFRFEIDILDNKNIKRTFISCNKQSITRIKPFQCSMPLELDQGWNQIVFNLEQYCDKAFGTHYVQCQKIQINANCRIARIYFNDTVKSEDQIPPQYKLFMRVQPFKS